MRRSPAHHGWRARYTVALALATLASSCGSATNNVGAASIDSMPSSSSPTTIESPTTSTTQATTTIAPVPVDLPPVFDPTLEVIENNNERLSALGGGYIIRNLGLEFSLEIEQRMLVHYIDNQSINFVALQGSGGSDQTMSFQRFTFLVDPAAPLGNPPTAGWPVEGIDSWLDTVDHIEISGRQSVKIGGYDAIQFDVAPSPENDCALYCVGLGNDGFTNAEWARVWWVLVPDSDPLVIMGRADVEGSRDEWFSSVSDIVSSIAFGPSSPAIVESTITPECDDQLGNGNIVVGSAGGLAFSVGSEQRMIMQTMAPCIMAVIHGQDPNNQIRIFIAKTDSAGNQVDDAQGIIDHINAAGITVKELPSTEVAGFPTKIVDVSSDGSGQPLIFAEGITDPLSDVSWSPPVVGRIWLVESDRGIIMVSASSFFQGVGAVDLVEEAESLVSTISLTEAE